MREQVGRSDLDTVLGVRGPLGSSAKERLQASLDAYRTGLVVTELNLPNARPPTEVQPAFDEVNSAQQVRESLVNQAQAYAAKIVPEARGEAARLRTTADGYKTASVARATGDADPLLAAAGAVQGRARSHPQAPVAGNRAGRAGPEPQGRRRRRHAS